MNSWPAATLASPADQPLVDPVLEARDLFKIYREGTIETVALRGAALTVGAGEFVAIIGRSGSGKSTLLSIAAGLVMPSAGTVVYDGRDLAALGEDERARLRRRRIGLVFQANNLIPFLSARENVELAIATGADRRQRATRLLEGVGLGQRVGHRPAQLSGGEQQRVAIAVALANDPVVLLADEPTGELDSATAAGVMQVLLDLNRERGMALVLVTHNLALAAKAGRRLRMVDGLLKPDEAVAEVVDDRAADRRPPPPTPRPPSGSVVLAATGLSKTYPGGVQALRGVDMTVHTGESLAIMGPSGCGKSTLLALLAGLDRPTGGAVVVDGQELAALDGAALALLRRRRMGIIFQAHSLLPTLTAAENVALPLVLDGAPVAERRQRARDLLARVGVPEVADQRPDQLSGGQRQRVAIARGLVHRPSLLLADEPTGSLDSESAAAVMALLAEMARDDGLALVIVTHDPLVAAHCQRVLHLVDGQPSAAVPPEERRS